MESDPTAPCASKKRQSSTSWNIAQKLRTNPRKHFEPRELLIYQLVLESDKLEEKRDQLTTRQKLDRETKNYVNIIIRPEKPHKKHEKEQKTRSQQKSTRKTTSRGLGGLN